MHEIRYSVIDEQKACRLLFWSITLLLLTGLAVACLALFMRSRHLLQEEMLSMARSHFNNIMLTRRWNAQYGGVYVRKEHGMESNPFLKNPDLETVGGITLTLKNSALMTKEISELARQEGSYTFHLTSLKPLNPVNRPDKFERMALEQFENGKKEIHTKTREGNEFFFNYMAPLYVEENCLKCHAAQGYKAGDVRGGIRVKFNVQNFGNIRKKALLQFLFIAACATCMIIALLYVLLQRFEQRISKARRKIQEMAIKDPLTGIYNRRYLMNRLEEELERVKRKAVPVGCLLIDIDHFKKINDRYGHLFGDVVLKELCTRIQAVIRPYDTFARFGGEEFVLILADANVAASMDVAARIVKIIKEKPFTYKGTSCNVTVSIGVSCATDTDIDSQTLLKKADKALYRAKQRGRDQIVLVN